MAQSPCSFLPLDDSPCSLFYSPPFTYLETLLGVIGSCPLWFQVADKLSPQYVPQVNGEGVCSEWRGANRCSSWVLRVHISAHQSPLHCTLSPAIHFNGSNGTAYNRASNIVLNRANFQYTQGYRVDILIYYIQ